MTKKELRDELKEFRNTIFSSTLEIDKKINQLIDLVNSSDISKSNKGKMIKEVYKYQMKAEKEFQKAWEKKIPFWKNHIKGIATGVAGVVTTGVVGAAAIYTSGKEASAEECEQTAVNSIMDWDKNKFVVPQSIEMIRPDLMIPNALPSNLHFDPNDNASLIKQAITFITNSLPCGIDFTSQKGISNYMDLYIVTNLDWLDPMDLARLAYYYDTPQSIVDGYEYSINQIATDLLTVTPDTMLSYDFIADIDSRDILMQFQTLMAQYNVAESQKEKAELEEAIKSFLYDHFTLQDGRGAYPHIIYEIIGRFSKAADLRLPNGLPKELTEILCEDLDDCFATVKNGDKKKSERAEALTAIFETLESKLRMTAEYRCQNLSVVAKIETLTGAQIEVIIHDSVKLSYKDFVANPTYKHIGRGTSTNRSSNVVESVTLPNGQEVSKDQAQEFGLDPATVTSEQYENAVIQQFKQNAQQEPGHTIADSNGNVVANGSEADANLAKQGATDAFNDGYNGRPFSPKYGGSYLAGYTMSNYNLGKKAKEEAEKDNSSTTFVPENGTPENIGETITEEGFKEDAKPDATNSGNQNSNPKEETSYIPVENGTSENIGETITEEGFIETETHFEPIASLSQLKAMRAILDTILVDPTVYLYSENTLFKFGYEVYDLSEKSMKM